MLDKSSREGFIKNSGFKDAEFQKLYKKYFVIVFRHVNYLLGGNSPVAEEIVQETFIKLYNSPPVSQNSLSAWLLKVATNTTYNHLRSDKQRVARETKVYNLESAGCPSSNLVEEVYFRNQQVLAVKEVLDYMPERDRICLLLKFSGFSYIEISEITGIQKGSVGTILARAQAKFRKEFLKRNGGDS